MGNLKRILVINPGSTTTKIAVYDGQTPLFTTTLEHPAEELEQFTDLVDQKDMRRNAIESELNKQGISLKSIHCIMGRGGLLHPIAGGTYTINAPMIADLQSGQYGVHASNLGAIIAYDISQAFHVPAYVVDPPVVDEMQPLAKYSGLPIFRRISRIHALNQKAVARRACAELKIPYVGARLIVAHMGGGITIGAHEKGRVVDTNDGLYGDGPFTPERAGSVPPGQLVDFCFSGQYTHAQVKRMLTGQGGLVAYLGTNSGKEVNARIREGDAKAKECYEAMAYQVAKSIGALAAVLCGLVDAVVLTGGLMHDDLLRQWIQKRVAFIAPVLVYPGEGEMEALVAAGLRVLSGEEYPKEYV